MLTTEAPLRPRQTPPVPHLGTLPQLLKVLADENRLRMFALLTKTELCVCELEVALGLSQSLVSSHLRVLKRAGLVRARRDEVDARWIYYSVDEQAVEGLRAGFLKLVDLSQMSHDLATCGASRLEMYA